MYHGYEKWATNWLPVLKVLQIFDLLLKIADDSVLQPSVTTGVCGWQRFESLTGHSTTSSMYAIVHCRVHSCLRRLA
jgi:hypothetical protein